jgi:hypothetical protein
MFNHLKKKKIFSATGKYSSKVFHDLDYTVLKVGYFLSSFLRRFYAYALLLEHFLLSGISMQYLFPLNEWQHNFTRERFDFVETTRPKFVRRNCTPSVKRIYMYNRPTMINYFEPLLSIYSDDLSPYFLWAFHIIRGQRYSIILITLCYGFVLSHNA